MATITIQTALKNDMAQVLTDDATLTLKAYNAPDPTADLLDSVAVTYGSPSSGVVDLSANATLTIASGETVDTVKLYSGAVQLASVQLTTDNSFPNGGDLIVTSYQITVA